MPKIYTQKRVTMKTKTLLNTIIIASLSLGACSTTPDPIEICSAEWIAPRVDQAMDEFERDTRKIFKKFRKAADSLQNGGSVGPLQLFSIMNALSSLTDKFENGRAIGDMRTLAQTCDDPKLIQGAMTDFMRKKGLPENFISFINEIDEYQKLLDTNIRPDINT